MCGAAPAAAITTKPRGAALYATCFANTEGSVRKRGTDELVSRGNVHVGVGAKLKVMCGKPSENNEPAQENRNPMNATNRNGVQYKGAGMPLLMTLISVVVQSGCDLL